ncbi:MAG: protease pro-enzyme activation domain-containing protein [Caldisphaera sp.]
MGILDKSIIKLSSIVFITVFLLAIATPFAFASSTSNNNNSTYYYGPSLNGTYLGNLQPNTIISFSIFFPPNNYSYLLFVSQEVANRQIKPLNRDEILNMFSPSQQEFYSVLNYLKESGFAITYQSPDRFSIMVEAPAYLVEKTFNVKLGLYKSNDGEIYYAPIGKPEIPSQLSNDLIFGLNNFTSFKPPNIISGKIIDKYFVLNSSNYRLYNDFNFKKNQEANSLTYYTPGDFEGAYNVTNIMQYSNKSSIAIIDAYGDPLIYQDISQFDSMFGLPSANLTIIPIGPYHPSLGILTEWDLETALDVEAAQTMAPYAHIYLVVASNSANALFEAIDYVVSLDLANVVSMSWGEPENLIALTGFYTSNPYYQYNEQNLGYAYADYYFALGSAEGISFFSSSGDQGAYGGTPELYGGVSFPSTSPFVTAVGGTSLFVNVTSGYLSDLNSSGKYGYENAWSVSPLYGTSEVASTGGYSTLIPKPWYQIGVVNGTYRGVPDVSADANPYTGFVEVVDGSLIAIGGTSLASPLWAGIAADIDGYLNTSLGLINPLLYSIYRNKTLYDKAFHQIDFGYNGYYTATSGYNLVTGLGSPNAGLLANAIKDVKNKNHLEISVTTYQLGAQYPWYMYNTSFEIVSDITYQNGTQVTSGNFNAYIYTVNGLLEMVPLKYNGQYWIGNVSIEQGMPANLWTVVVNGTSSNNLTSVGATDLDIGVGLAIIWPFSYPYGAPLIPNYPFYVIVFATLPNGMPDINLSLTAYLIKNGVVYYTTPLISEGNGYYINQMILPYPDPQGSYILMVNSSEGNVYTYEYFGEAFIESFVVTPVNDGMPSASPGETVILAALVEDPFGYGMFTSSISAKIYNLSNYLVAQIPLQPTSSGLQEGFFTIPSNLTPGFYNVVFISNETTAISPLYGYANQSFYVSPSSLNTEVKSISTAYEGQYLDIYANISYQNGSEVKYGTFTATLLPDQYYSSLFLFSFEIGIPLQYNSSLNEWIGEIQLPSLSSPGIYAGLSPSELSGPWSITVSGESANGNDVISRPYNLYLEPYTYIGSMLVNQSNVTSLPLGTLIGSSIVGIYSQNLVIKNASLTIVNSNIINLTIVNSSIKVMNSNIGTLIANKSNISLLNDNIGPGLIGISLIDSNANITNTVFENLLYAFSQLNSKIKLSGLTEYNVTSLSKISVPQIISIYPRNITSYVNRVIINVSNANFVPISVFINGIPVTYTYKNVSGVLEISVPFNSTELPDGPYTITVTLSNGLIYNVSGQVYNNYHLLSLISLIEYTTNITAANISSVSSQLQSYISSNVTLLTNKISSVSSQLQSYISSNVTLLTNKISSVSSSLSSVNSTLTTQINNLQKMISSVNATATTANKKGSTSYAIGISGLSVGLIGIIIGGVALALRRVIK